MVRPLANQGQLNRTTRWQDPLNSLRGLWRQQIPLRYGFQAWQPRSVVPPSWTQPEMVQFWSEANRQRLKREIYRQSGGRNVIGDSELLRQMSENGAQWYLTMYTEETYGPRTEEDRARAVHMMNERTVRRVQQLFEAQRGVTSKWLQFHHQGPETNWQQPEYTRTADYSHEIERN